MLVLFCDRVLLCNPGWPGTCPLELEAILCQVFPSALVYGLVHHMPGLTVTFCVFVQIVEVTFSSYSFVETGSH